MKVSGVKVNDELSRCLIRLVGENFGARTVVTLREECVSEKKGKKVPSDILLSDGSRYRKLRRFWHSCCGDERIYTGHDAPLGFSLYGLLVLRLRFSTLSLPSPFPSISSFFSPSFFPRSPELSSSPCGRSRRKFASPLSRDETACKSETNDTNVVSITTSRWKDAEQRCRQGPVNS